MRSSGFLIASVLLLTGCGSNKLYVLAKQTMEATRDTALAIRQDAESRSEFTRTLNTIAVEGKPFILQILALIVGVMLLKRARLIARTTAAAMKWKGGILKRALGRVISWFRARLPSLSRSSSPPSG